MYRCPSCDQMHHVDDGSVTGPDGLEYCRNCADRLRLVNPRPEYLFNDELNLAAMVARFFNLDLEV